LNQNISLTSSLSEYALFLDFDGTLALIQSNASDVKLSAETEKILLSLTKKLGLGPVIISGRDIHDLAVRVPKNLHRIGNHGLRSAEPLEVADKQDNVLPAELAEHLDHILKEFPGCFAEKKGPIVAVHFRDRPQHAEALKVRLLELPLAEHEYEFESGKMIYELKPIGASKGIALQHVMTKHPKLLPIMIGDDTTDESAMVAAQELGGFAVKVGIGETSAKYRVAAVDDVHRILHEWDKKTELIND